MPNICVRKTWISNSVHVCLRRQTMFFHMHAYFVSGVFFHVHSCSVSRVVCSDLPLWNASVAHAGSAFGSSVATSTNDLIDMLIGRAFQNVNLIKLIYYKIGTVEQNCRRLCWIQHEFVENDCFFARWFIFAIYVCQSDQLRGMRKESSVSQCAGPSSG
jgi:hypothetical protein